MDDRQSIIGFTEAELGFFLVLLLVLLGLVVAARNTQPSPAPQQQQQLVSRDSANRLLAQLSRLQRELDSLKSPILPNCRSTGIAAGPLFTAIAIGYDQFRVDDQVMSSAQVAARTAAERHAAVVAGCRHEIRFGVDPRISAAESEHDRHYLNALGLRLISTGSD